VVQSVSAGEHFAVLITMGYDGGAGVKFAAVPQGHLIDPAGVGQNGVYLALGQTSNSTFAVHQASQNMAGQMGGARTNALGSGI
jgi:hypothetical protein